MWLFVKHQETLVGKLWLTRNPKPEVYAKFKRHVQSGNLASLYSLTARKIMNRVAAFLHKPCNLGQPDFASVGTFSRDPRDQAR